MESLDSIVASLEGDQFSLEQMVSSYERGMRLLRVCRARIDRARQRVESITMTMEGQEEKAALSEFAAMEAVTATTSSEGAAGSDPSPKRAPKKKPATDDSTEEEDIRLF